MRSGRISDSQRAARGRVGHGGGVVGECPGDVALILSKKPGREDRGHAFVVKDKFVFLAFEGRDAGEASSMSPSSNLPYVGGCDVSISPCSLGEFDGAFEVAISL